MADRATLDANRPVIVHRRHTLAERLTLCPQSRAEG
jgi:hypothetical protein